MTRIARPVLSRASLLRVRRAAEVGAGMGMALVAVFAASVLPSRLQSPAAPPASSTSSPASGAPAGVPPQAPPAAAFAAIALPERAPRIASYTLKVSLDPATHRLHGEGTIVWTNASRLAQRELYLHLYLNAFKNDRTALLRERGVAGRGSAALADFGYTKVTRLHAREWNSDLWAGAEPTTPGDPEDETDIRVPLPQSVEPGQSITIDLSWDAKLPAVNIRTGYDDSFHMVGQWFPKLARLEASGRWAHFPFQRFSEFYADYGLYDVTIDVPDSFVVGATGRLESEEKQAGRAVRRFVQDNVHDFAFTAWDQFREMTSATEDGVHIRCLYPPGHDKAAEAEIAAARFGLAHLGAAYGRYPYETLTIVHPPSEAGEAGGMEYPTLITTGGPWFAPYTGVRAQEIVTIHELGHQWFYGLLASNEHDFPFLDEGLNSFAEADALETLYPKRSVMDSLGMTMSLPAAHRLRSSDFARGAPVAQPAPAFTTGAEYGALVYGRTSTILTTLAQVYGADRLKLALGRYARQNRFSHPGPQELLASIQEAMGPEVADNLRVALFDKGWVDYEIARVESSKNDPPAGIFGDPDAAQPVPTAEDRPPWRGYAIVRRKGTLRFPVDVDLVAADGTVTRTAWDAQASSIQIEYTGRTPLVAAVVDPDHRVLLDDDLGNNARRSKSFPLAPRVLERAVFTAELALLLVAP